MDKKRLWKVIFLLLFAVLGSSFITHEVSAKKITVYTIEFPVKPGVYWYEQDSGQFRADTVIGPKLTNQSGNTNEPVKTEVRNEHDMRTYGIPNEFTDKATGDSYEKSKVSNIQLSSVRWDSNYVGDTFKPVNQWIGADGFTLHTITETGYGYKTNEKYAYNTVTGKYLVSYLTPLVIVWKAEIEIPDTPETPKDPPPTETENNGGGGSCSYSLNLGGVSNTMNASVLSASPTGTIESQTGEFDVVQGIPSSEHLKTSASSLEYLFDQSYEQQQGNVSYSMTMTKDFTLTWNEKKPPAKPGDPETTEPKSETVTESVDVQVEKDFTYWTVNKYDVWSIDRAVTSNYALPNGESLMSAAISIAANATHSTDVNSHVFPSPCPSTTLPSETISGGEEKPDVPDFSSEAEQTAESEIEAPTVKNDSAEFKGSVLMSNADTSGGNGPTPTNIPNPSTIMLSNENLLIDPLKTNYWQSPSSGMLYYKGDFSLASMPSEKAYPYAVNNVTVHTPVVIYSRSTDDKEHDQRTNPPVRSTPANADTDRHALILDRSFTVSLPTTGGHRSIPGYGTRDFAKYTREKQVKFPFDVYSETKAAFYPANTWISVPINLIDVTFFMPVWVPENSYTVDFRVFAINAPNTMDFGGTEHHANTTIPNTNYNVSPAGTQTAAHTAYDSIEVDVVGRLYDFRVTDISDYNYAEVFKSTDGITHNDISYYVGKKGIDGNLRGNESPFILPVRQGSHPNGYDNVAVKTGYTFGFDLKTKGNMYDGNDAIRINPTFYFIDKMGIRRDEVDVYYHDTNDYFVKIGSAEDTTYRSVVLNATHHTLKEDSLADNASYYYNHASEYDGMTKLVAGKYETSFTRDYLRKISKNPVVTGPYGWQILNWNLRTFIGPKPTNVPSTAMVSKKDAVAREQQWYGEYSLPTNVYVVPKATTLNNSLNESSPIFLKDGYIIVNFDLETIDKGDLVNPRLQYINGQLMNQWSNMEGFQHTFTDSYGYTFPLLDGDVMFYHGDRNSDDDFAPSITH